MIFYFILFLLSSLKKNYLIIKSSIVEFDFHWQKIKLLIVSKIMNDKSKVEWSVIASKIKTKSISTLHYLMLLCYLPAANEYMVSRYTGQDLIKESLTSRNISLHSLSSFFQQNVLVSVSKFFWKFVTFDILNRSCILHM